MTLPRNPYLAALVLFALVVLVTAPDTVIYVVYGVIRLIVWPFTRTKTFPLGMCQKCGYNLRGNISGICPECGTPCGKPPVT